VDKLVKPIFYIVAAIFITLSLAVAIVPMLLDPNDYKDEIKNAVKSATGRTLTIDGVLSLSIFPWLGIETGHLSLSNATGFAEEPFVEIEKTNIKVKLIPLFSKRIRVNQIVLNGLRLNLVKNEQGKNNWSTSHGSTPSKHKKRIPIKGANSISSTPKIPLGLANLAIEKITLENAKINWFDRQAQRNLSAENLYFHMDKFRFNETVDFKLSTVVKTAKPKTKHQVSITGRLTVQDDLNVYKMERFHIASSSEDSINGNPAIQSDLNAAAALNLSQNTFAVFKLDFKLDDLHLQSDFSGTGIDREPTIEGSIKIDSFNPRNLAKHFGQTLPTLADPNAIISANAAFDFKQHKSVVDLANIVVQIDQTSIKGAASIDRTKPPLVKFNLDANKLDVDRYFPTKDATTNQITERSETEPTNSDAGLSETANTNAMIKTPNLAIINLDGIFNIGALKILNIRARGAQIVVNAKNRIVRTNQRIKNLYRGHYRGAMELNLQGVTPTISVNEKFSKINLEPLLKDLTGEAKITGRTTATLQLTARGADPDSIKSSLNGNVEALLSDGYIKGVDLVKIIGGTRNLIESKSGQQTTTSDETQFTEMRIAATITDGLVKTRTLNAKSQTLTIDGGGRIYLVNEAVDLNIKAKINDDPAGFEGIKIKELQGVSIPIKISGTFSKLSYRPDLKSVLTSPQIQKTRKKLKKKLGEKLGPEVQNLLDRLF